MVSIYYNGVLQNPFDTNPEPNSTHLGSTQLTLPFRPTNTKPYIEDKCFQQLISNSKETDNLLELNDNKMKCDHFLFDQVHLSRICSKLGQQVQNTSSIRCYQLIAQQYQLAFSKIQAVLSQKQIELHKIKSEYQIQISQKDQIIEDLKSIYQQQLEKQDHNITRLNMQVNQLSQKINKQDTQIISLTSQNDRQSQNSKKQQKCSTIIISQAYKKINQLQETLSQFSKYANSNSGKLKIERQQLILENLGKSLQPTLALESDDSHDLEYELKDQISELQRMNKSLQMKIQIKSEEIRQLQGYKSGYYQYSCFLQNSLEVNRKMLEQIQTLKTNLIFSLQKQKWLEQSITSYKSRIYQLQFSTKTLSSYNTSLLRSKKDEVLTKENQFSMVNLRKQSSKNVLNKFFK